MHLIEMWRRSRLKKMMRRSEACKHTDVILRGETEESNAPCWNFVLDEIVSCSRVFFQRGEPLCILIASFRVLLLASFCFSRCGAVPAWWPVERQAVHLLLHLGKEHSHRPLPCKRHQHRSLLVKGHQHLFLLIKQHPHWSLFIKGPSL